MDALIHAFWRILLLRAAPQSVPASQTLLWLALALHGSVGLLISLFSMPFALALPYALVSTLTMVAVVHGLLLLFRKHSRYIQALTALAACEALLGVMLLPLSVLLYLGGGEGLHGGLLLISLLVLGWNMAVAAHIFRHALSVSIGLGFLYSVAYLLIAMTLGDMVSAAGMTQ